MCRILVLLPSILLLASSSSFASIAPSYIQPCPVLTSECLKKAIQEVLPKFANGIPELGVDSIDPLRNDHANLVLPGGFKVTINNGTMTGLKKCNINSASYKNHEVDVTMQCDLTIKGQYKANGRILIVLINGDGDAKIKIKNATMRAKIKFHDRVRDGVAYYEVKDVDIKQDYGEKVTFSLTNLFQGNPELSQAVLQFLNQNWKQVAEEFGQPLVDQLVDIASSIIKKFFEVVPKEELIK